MNNFHHSNNIYDLIEILLEEHFGKAVSTLGNILISNGPTTILELCKLSSWEYTEVRNALIIMMQNKLLFYEEKLRKEQIETVYEVDVDTILNYLRFPKILYFINNYSDQNAMMIFEEFMQYGILSAGQVIEQVKEKIHQLGNASISSINNLKLGFIKLIENGFIIQCTQRKTRDIRDELSKRRKAEKKNSVGVSKKKRKLNSLDDDNELGPKDSADITGNTGKVDKNPNKESRVSNVIIEDENPLIYNKEKGKYFYFCLNFDKIITELKCELVVDLVSQRMDGQAGNIASIMLRKNPGNSFKEGKSFPMTVNDIIKLMGFTTKDKKIMNEKQESIRVMLDAMSRAENDFVLPWGTTDSGSSYALNLESIAVTLKNKTLEKIIEQEFSSDHIRIYRLLSKCGPLDSKNIMEICLMPHKECSACLNQLIEMGFVETQVLNYKGSNVIFYNTNTKNNIEMMIAKIYKIIKNLKYFLKSAIEKIKNTESITKQEAYINKVYSTISELDDTIILLKHF